MMPKGLYFTAVVFFFFFFFRRLISQVTERILAELGHIFTYDFYLKNLVQTPPGIYRHGLGQKCLLGPTLNLDRIYLCHGTWYQQSERNMSIYRDYPTWLHIWWTLFQKRLRTVSKFLPTRLNFCIGDTASLTAWTLYNRQLANFGTWCVVARAYSQEQKMSGGLTLGFAMHLV